MSKTNLKQRIIKLIYPVDCLECGEEGEWLCGRCARKYRLLSLKRCFICNESAKTGICNKCQRNNYIDGIISLLPYHQDASFQLIYNAKYYGHHDAINFIISIFRHKILRLIPENFQYLTFTPSSVEKLKERGYNPAELAAKALTDEDFEVIDVFKKIKETPSQTSLSKIKRRKNVKNAFRVKSKDLPDNLVIVDDVITTGSTLRELAILAKKKGVKNIWVVTICHG